MEMTESATQTIRVHSAACQQTEHDAMCGTVKATDTENYRPVSNLPFLAKLPESFSNTAATSSGSAQTDAAVPVSISS